MAERDTLAAFAVQLDELRAKVATLEQEGPGKMMVVLAQVKKLSDALNRALGKNKTLIPQAPYSSSGTSARKQPRASSPTGTSGASLPFSSAVL